MNRSTLIFGVFPFIFAATAFGQATAFRGTHVGFTTALGQAGQRLDLRTGYGTSGAPESEQWSYRFQTVATGVRQLQTRTDRYANNPNPDFAQVSFNLWDDAPTRYVGSEGGGASPVAGWYAQSTMPASASNPATRRSTFNPTGGDNFIATGNLIGGSFAYEILSVTPLQNSPIASFAFGQLVNPAGNTSNALRQLRTSTLVGSTIFDTFGIYDSTLAGGGTQTDRSIFLGNGNHFEGWGFFVSAQGRYEVAVRVYDVNNVYAASDVFTFQVNSIPTPSAAGMLGLAGLAAFRRRRT